MLFSLFNQIFFLELCLLLFINVQMSAVIFCKSVHYAVRFSYVLALWSRAMEVIFMQLRFHADTICTQFCMYGVYPGILCIKKYNIRTVSNFA